MRCATVLAILALMPVTDGIAQDVALQPGQRVRVTAPDVGLNRHESVFESVAHDTLFVTASGTTRGYPLSSVTHIEVYAGRRGHLWTGALIGAPVGGLIGIAVVASPTGSAGSITGFSRPASDGAIVVGSILGGAFWGAIVGALIKSDNWEQVPVNRRRVTVVPRRNGVGIGARIAF